MEKRKIPVMGAVNTVLAVAAVCSIVVNVNQYNSNRALTNELATVENEIDTLNTESDNLDKNMQSEQENLSSLTAQIESLKTDIEVMEDENRNLSDSLSEMEKNEQALDDEMDNTSIELTAEDEALADQIAEEILKEHPEWLAGTTTQGNYEHVGTPSTGELPTFNFGQGDYSQLGDNVIVY
ncbi:MAG: hypothetical protein NC548_53470 [Lachnospiraceae bacterium]|nr:hypothetical protein [Lachnospiraceae bacterium]